MNTQSNATSGSSFEPQGAAPAAMSATRPFYWSVRRELWENRSIYLAPLAVAGVYLCGFLISMPHLPRRMRAALALDPQHQYRAMVMPYHIAAGLIMGTAIIVAVFYCFDSLQGERRDRSILFWKSLPVSDRTTVLAKATIPIVILQLFTFAVVVVTQFIMLLLSSAVLAGSGISPAMLWTQVSLFSASVMLDYHLVTVHILWHAPFYGWMLMVSAWARRVAFLWAILPPLAICFIEKVAFNTNYFAGMLLHRLSGGPEAMPMSPDQFPVEPGMHLTPGHYLASPGLWLGLLVTALFLAAAIRLRRYREPI